MSDKPIIFSAPMVRALLEGRKTQTRRILKPQPFPVGGPFYRPFPNTDPRQWYSVSAAGLVVNIQTVPYATGDRLYVREAIDKVSGPENVFYRADYEAGGNDGRGLGWRPSIHMPRWASRLTLTVTDVRVQRLQDISEADAVAEGVDAVTMADVPRQAAMSRRSDFAALWNSLHGPDAWDANPWIAAYSFNAQRGNIDQIGGAA